MENNEENPMNYFLTHEKVYVLFVKTTGEFINGRQWDKEIDALTFLRTLPYFLQDQIIILPKAITVLKDKYS